MFKKKINTYGFFILTVSKKKIIAHFIAIIRFEKTSQKQNKKKIIH